ncbi:MAG: metalloregulator ArsR/SmtB family transcription factor [Pseudomonadota bacterium]|nr:metalloregulator ArsR/SmtB family transcription factor [Pseudomonadota bacterium]
MVSPRGAVDLQAQSEQAAKLLKALANPDRLLLLCHLVQLERSVAELGDLTGIAQPSLSQQLSVLRAEDLVATRREGKSIFYRIEAPAVHAVLQTLYRIYCEGPLSSPPRKRVRT